MISIGNRQTEKLKHKVWLAVFMKNFIHTIASFSFVIWAVGYFAYDVPNRFHYLLLVAVVAAAIRIWAFKRSDVKKTKGSDIQSANVDNHDAMG
jgi:hypothetical protein